MLALYQDAHIPLLTEIVVCGSYVDNPVLLAAKYPDVQSILCEDELPDMTPLLPFASVWYEHGTKSNARIAAYAIAHFFLAKTNMQSCQTHSVIDLAYQYCNTIPNFALLLQNVLRASLVGNLSVSRNRLVLCARIRVESAMTDPLRGTTQRGKLMEVPRGKKKRKRQKQREGVDGGECRPEEPNWLAWFRDHQYVLTFLMREWHVQVVSDSSVFSSIVEQHVKVRQGAVLVCTTNAAIRAEINRQCVRHTDPRTPIEWENIDGGKHGGATGGGENTLIGYSHVRSRLTFMHLRHSSFVKLLWDKIKVIEYDLSTHDPNFDTLFSFPLGVSEDVLHFTSWYVACKSDCTIEEFSVLKALGMSEVGFSLVRDMQYVYYEYKYHDNRYARWLAALYNNSTKDFALLCRFLALIRHYRKLRVFYLPAEQKAMQIIQQRRSVPLETFDLTTDNLGVVHFCDSCGSWGMPVVSFSTTITPHAIAHSLSRHTPMNGGPHRYTDGTSKSSVTDASLTTKAPSYVVHTTRCYVDVRTGRVYCKNSATKDEGRESADISKRSPRFLRDAIVTTVVPKTSCASKAMRRVFMPGTLRKIGAGIIGMCSFCKDACKVRIENWTSHGITCGRHDIREYGDTHPIALAFDAVYDK
jgi:hypothetical protein